MVLSEDWNEVVLRCLCLFVMFAVLGDGAVGEIGSIYFFDESFFAFS
jgi:hypothetical protein